MFKGPPCLVNPWSITSYFHVYSICNVRRQSRSDFAKFGLIGRHQGVRKIVEVFRDQESRSKTYGVNNGCICCCGVPSSHIQASPRVLLSVEFEFTLVCKCQYLFRASLMDEENCCKLAWRNPYNYPWMYKVNTEQHKTSISMLAVACSASVYHTS